MKDFLWFALLALFLLGFAACVPVRIAPEAGRAPALSIIPKPQASEGLSGVFLLGPGSKIRVPADCPELGQVARDFAARIEDGAGCKIQVEEASSGQTLAATSGGISFIKSSREEFGPEGYSLSVEPGAVMIKAAEAAGFFYAFETILQLLPPAIDAQKAPAAGSLILPAVQIVDSPRYPWRGMLLDVSRHFFPKEFIKKFIDYLAAHKMNVFHWHLTDDQGWRVEIKKYPRLTEVGAWRVNREDKHWNAREPQKEGEIADYGGYYSQDDIREIVAFAKSRFVTVVPEIEMPGHCLAALAAYPQYSCTGGPFTVPPGGAPSALSVYCAGNDETFAFLEDVLTEVLDLFPGEYIHIGGDEVDKTTWKSCPKCQARIAAEGLKNEEELQSYFIRRIEKFLNSKGRKLIGWDEILEGGLAPMATVMSWRGMQGGMTAARESHDVVMSPTSYCYFDYYQGQPALEPLAIGGNLPLSKVYSFEPTPSELTADEAKHVLGVQANVWTEYIPSPRQAEYMIFPRIAAIAEVGWSEKAGRNWEDFASRIRRQFERYRSAGINYARSAYDVRVTPQLDVARRAVLMKLETELPGTDIRYTLNGRDPKLSSTAYRTPVRLKKTAVLKAAAFEAGRLMSRVTETPFFAHKALAVPPKLEYPYKERYRGGGDIGLTDGLRGTKSHTDGRWQGFEGDDLVAEIDLGKPRKISRITAGFLQNINAWIFLPVSVEFSISREGQDYRVIRTVENDISPRLSEITIKDFAAEVGREKARFIRVRAKNIGVCPEWHFGAGRKAWLFADEIIVE
jgi:hexosaminidase